MNRIQGLYLVTDRDLCGGRPLKDVVLQAVKGGAACVQLREKDPAVTTRRFVEEARAIKDLLTPLHVPLIVNDRLDVALAVGADGVHIGQQDMPYGLARQILGPKALIGLSVEGWADVEAALALDVDYLGVSPVFDTLTKTDTKAAWGLQGLSRIRAATTLPLVAIGGLNVNNAEAVVMEGADSIAVVSAICAAPDPRAAAAELTRIIAAALARRSS
jgi:thiamine-phosphate pyrophosphorylase